ncbi:MAG: ATP-binding protein [Desulfovibrio sp.]|nr:ATP-binding protein [Desulfovibrio sp.]
MSTIPPALPDHLLELIRHGEDYRIEYKEARKELPKNLFATVTAFANRDGGDIFLGVHATGVIVGIDATLSAKFITNFITLAHNKEEIFPSIDIVVNEYVYISDGSFVGIDKNGKTLCEQAGTYHIIHIHVPVSCAVVRHKVEFMIETEMLILI